MAGRVILVGLCLLAGNLHGCGMLSLNDGPGPVIRTPTTTVPIYGDCSGDQPTDPCVIVPEPTFP